MSSYLCNLAILLFNTIRVLLHLKYINNDTLCWKLSYYQSVYLCDDVVINTLPWTCCLFDIVSDIESGGRQPLRGMWWVCRGGWSRLQATHHMILIIFCLAISAAPCPKGLNSHYCLAWGSITPIYRALQQAVNALLLKCVHDIT